MRTLCLAGIGCEERGAAWYGSLERHGDDRLGEAWPCVDHCLARPGGERLGDERCGADSVQCVVGMGCDRQALVWTRCLAWMGEAVCGPAWLGPCERRRDALRGWALTCAAWYGPCARSRDDRMGGAVQGLVWILRLARSGEERNGKVGTGMGPVSGDERMGDSMIGFVRTLCPDGL